MSIIRRLKNRINIILKRRFGIKIPVVVPAIEGQLLKGRTILITGGASGIGKAIAEACLRNGANVVICGRNLERLIKTKEEFTRHYGDRVYEVQMDISDIQSIKQSFPIAIEKAPNNLIDTLINNAGVAGGGSFGNTSPESFSQVMDTNLRGTYFISEYFFKYLHNLSVQGNILNVSSSSSSRPANNPYSISKWGEAGFTKGLAKQLLPYGIVVNSVAPGPTAAGMMEKASGGDLTRPSSPSGRYVTAEEIANVAVFLISDMGRMIVGETVYVTGGMGTLTFDDVDY